MNATFICAENLSLSADEQRQLDELGSVHRDGSLYLAWRIDAEGRAWLKAFPPIEGVPSDD